MMFILMRQQEVPEQELGFQKRLISVGETIICLITKLLNISIWEKSQKVWFNCRMILKVNCFLFRIEEIFQEGFSQPYIHFLMIVWSNWLLNTKISIKMNHL